MKPDIFIIIIINVIIFIVLIDALDLFIHPDGNYVSLKPETGGLDSKIETMWDLQTNKGSKIVAECSFSATNCSNIIIKIYNGEEFLEICPEYCRQFKNISIDNNMTITIDNLGKTINAQCKVRATKQYLKIQNIAPIDSREDGIVNDKYKNTTCRCGWSNKHRNKQAKIGRKQAGLNEFPFMALIRHKLYGIFCGGSIITAKHILTAAHCLNTRKKDPLQVVLGEYDLRTRKESNNRQIIDVETIIIHPEYDANDNNDIGLLKLKIAIKYNNDIGPICLPMIKQKFVGKYIKSVGWGKIEDRAEGGKTSPILMKTNLQIIDIDICKVIYDILHNDRQICTYTIKKEICTGDLGGPLIAIDHKTNMFNQIAIVSFVRKCGLTDPGVNTNISYYMNWIVEQIKSKENKVQLCY